MVRYLSSGIRKFGESPIGSHSRINWEFYAVVDGRCGVLLETGEKLALQSSHLWVFPPHHAHGWHGEERPCNIAVLHCGAVPRQLTGAIPPSGFLERDLTEAECAQVVGLVRTLEVDYHHRNSLSGLRFDRAILDLTLLALEGTDSPAPIATNKRTTEKVDAAVAWFRRHLREKPTMDEVAASVHVSPSHLRRLFMTVLKQSPRTVLGNTQIEVAMRLLSGSDLKIESIAAEAGFASGRDFSRVFSAHQGCSPSDWRRRVQPPYAGSAHSGNGENGA